MGIKVLLARSPFFLKMPFNGIHFGNVILIDSDVIYHEYRGKIGNTVGLKMSPEEKFFSILNHELWHAANPNGNIGGWLYAKSLRFVYNLNKFRNYVVIISCFAIFMLTLHVLFHAFSDAFLIFTLVAIPLLVIPLIIIVQFLHNEWRADHAASSKNIDRDLWIKANARYGNMDVGFNLLSHLKRVRGYCGNCDAGKREKCWNEHGDTKESLPSIYGATKRADRKRITNPDPRNRC